VARFGWVISRSVADMDRFNAWLVFVQRIDFGISGMALSAMSVPAHVCSGVYPFESF